MEIPQTSRSNHLDQTRDFVQGSQIVLLDKPVPVDRFQPGVFSTFVSLPIAAQDLKNLPLTEGNFQPDAAGSCGILKFPFLNYHLERVIANGIAVGLLPGNCLDTTDGRSLKQTVTELLEAGRLRSLPQLQPGDQAICRIVVSRGDLSGNQPKTALTIDKHLPKRPPGKPVTAVSIETVRDLPEIKSTNLGICRAAADFALRSGADEAVLIDKDGAVREGAWSNLFWVDFENRIWTVKDRVLPGIVRRVLLELGAATPAKDEITLKQLVQEAREIFITQSTAGIIPVGSIDGTKIGTGLIGQVTGEIARRYDAACLNN